MHGTLTKHHQSLLADLRTTAVTNARVTKSSPNKKNAVKQEKKDEAKEGAEEDIFYGVDFSADFGDVGMDDGELAF